MIHDRDQAPVLELAAAMSLHQNIQVLGAVLEREVQDQLGEGAGGGQHGSAGELPGPLAAQPAE